MKQSLFVFAPITLGYFPNLIWIPLIFPNRCHHAIFISQIPHVREGMKCLTKCGFLAKTIVSISFQFWTNDLIVLFFDTE